MEQPRKRGLPSPWSSQENGQEVKPSLGFEPWSVLLGRHRRSEARVRQVRQERRREDLLPGAPGGDGLDRPGSYVQPRGRPDDLRDRQGRRRAHRLRRVLGVLRRGPVGRWGRVPEGRIRLLRPRQERLDLGDRVAFCAEEAGREVLVERLQEDDQLGRQGRRWERELRGVQGDDDPIFQLIRRWLVHMISVGWWVDFLVSRLDPLGLGID